MTSQPLSSAPSPQSSWLSQTQSFAMQTVAHLNSSFAHLIAAKRKSISVKKFLLLNYGKGFRHPSSTSSNKNLRSKPPHQPSLVRTPPVSVLKKIYKRRTCGKFNEPNSLKLCFWKEWLRFAHNFKPLDTSVGHNELWEVLAPVVYMALTLGLLFWCPFKSV